MRVVFIHCVPTLLDFAFCGWISSAVKKEPLKGEGITASLWDPLRFSINATDHGVKSVGTMYIYTLIRNRVRVG